VLVLLLLIGAGFAAWFAYGKIRDELNANKPVAVPYVVGLKKAQAVKKITDKDLKAKTVPGFSEVYPAGTVMSQSIDGGEKTDKGNTVRLTVSNGRPKTTIPDVVGKAQSDAVAALTAAHLKVSVFHVYSSASPDTVTGQNPPGDSRVFWNTKVRINVSQGVKQIEIPNVVGQPYASARSALLGAGLNATETLVDSNQPADTVVAQSPGAGNESGLRDDGDAQRLTRLDRDDARSGRHEPGRADREGDPDGLRVQGEDGQTAGDRPRRAGDRRQPAAWGRDERRGGFDGDDLRRRLHRHDNGCSMSPGCESRSSAGAARASTRSRWRRRVRCWSRSTRSATRR
jgi:hypothetical protein